MQRNLSRRRSARLSINAFKRRQAAHPNPTVEYLGYDKNANGTLTRVIRTMPAGMPLAEAEKGAALASAEEAKKIGNIDPGPVEVKEIELARSMRIALIASYSHMIYLKDGLKAIVDCMKAVPDPVVADAGEAIKAAYLLIPASTPLPVKTLEAFLWPCLTKEAHRCWNTDLASRLTTDIAIQCGRMTDLSDAVERAMRCCATAAGAGHLHTELKDLQIAIQRVHREARTNAHSYMIRVRQSILESEDAKTPCPVCKQCPTCKQPQA